MTREVSLSVNDMPIPCDYFVQSFIDHVMGSMMEALEETGETKTLDFIIEGEKVSISLNSRPVSINPFVMKITRSTVIGMVSSLKGVKDANKVVIRIKH